MRSAKSRLRTTPQKSSLSSLCLHTQEAAVQQEPSSITLLQPLRTLSPHPQPPPLATQTLHRAFIPSSSLTASTTARDGRQRGGAAKGQGMSAHGQGGGHLEGSTRAQGQKWVRVILGDLGKVIQPLGASVSLFVKPQDLSACFIL